MTKKEILYAEVEEEKKMFQGKNAWRYKQEKQLPALYALSYKL